MILWLLSTKLTDYPTLRTHTQTANTLKVATLRQYTLRSSLSRLPRLFMWSVLGYALLTQSLAESSAQPRVGPTQPDAWLKRFLDRAAQVPDKRARQALKRVLDDPARYRFQILVSEYIPTQEGDNHPTFKLHDYRVDQEYIYPASAMKVFGALSALRHYTLLRSQGPSGGKPLTWLTTNDALGSKRSCKRPDKSNLREGLSTLEHEIKKTHLVSSNRAFNRLFGVTGFRQLHEYLLPYFPSVRVFHRLSSRETHQECLQTPPLYVCDVESIRGGSAVATLSSSRVFSRPAFISSGDISDLEARLDPSAPTGFGTRRETMKVGRAYISMKSKNRVSKPMDFSYKNRVSFYDFQRLMMGIFRPRSSTPLGGPIALLQPFKEDSKGIRTVWLRELRHAMAIYPRFSKNPTYPQNVRSETRFKPLISGVRLGGGALKDDRSLYYLNKAGKALGFHLDNAFIAYGPKAGVINSKGFGEGRIKRGLFITVGLYVNQDETLNDDRYEYKKTSIPLFKAVGYAVGQYLLGEL